MSSNRRKRSPETKAALLADYASGMSMEAAAKNNSVSPATAHKWVQDAGMSRNRGAARKAAAQQKRDAEFGLAGGHWMPNPRGIQVWQPCFYNEINLCTINHQENRNAA